MLTRRQTGIALRCSACGNTSLFPISLFALGSSRRELRCSCGQHILTVSRRGTDVWTQLACFLCDGVHLFKFPDKNFWSREVKSILCPDTGAEIGYIGPVWNLLRVADMREEILPRLAALFGDCVAGARMLKRLLEMDDMGGLRCSECDQPVDIEVYSEGIEVGCAACGRNTTIPVGGRPVDSGRPVDGGRPMDGGRPAQAEEEFLSRALLKVMKTGRRETRAGHVRRVRPKTRNREIKE